jgi:hypothetical protein
MLNQRHEDQHKYISLSFQFEVFGHYHMPGLHAFNADNTVTRGNRPCFAMWELPTLSQAPANLRVADVIC